MLLMIFFIVPPLPRLRLDNTGADSQAGQSCRITQCQLIHYIGLVHADSLGADVQQPGNVCHRLPLGQLAKYLELTFREVL
jgi:hypothetical protein